MRLDINEKDRFILRVAGIAINNKRVLLHRADFDDFWTLPGGNCEFYEDTEYALQREFFEELQAKIEIDKLVWLVENFFEYEGKRGHEIGMYYKINFDRQAQHYYNLSTFEGEEIHHDTGKKFKLIYKWHSFDELQDIDIKPSFLAKKLIKIPENIEKITHKDLRVATL